MMMVHPQVEMTEDPKEGMMEYPEVVIHLPLMAVMLELWGVMMEQILI